MSERHFFSLRYSIPGYTFILLIIAVNHIPLIEILRQTGAGSAFGAFLAFLSLLAGSALGFLISQVWWFWFTFRRQKSDCIYGISELMGASDTFLEQLRTMGLKKGIESNRDVMLGISDYMIHGYLGKGEMDNLLVYAQRRWDMYHILSSTFHVIWMGLGMAMLCRLIFVCMHSIPQPNELLEFVWGGFLESREAIVLIGILAGAIFMLLVFRHLRKELMKRYNPILEALIRKSSISAKGKLREVFPQHFNPEAYDSG